jgi:hypothetical protein
MRGQIKNTSEGRREDGGVKANEEGGEQQQGAARRNPASQPVLRA